MDDILIVDSVSYAYGTKQPVLKNISFKIKKGQFVAIFGRNGSGKTTLFNLISGVRKIQKGNIFISNKNLRNLKQNELSRLLAIVPQELQSSYSFTNLEIVLMGRFCYQKRLGFESVYDYNSAYHAMELTKTSHLADRFFDEISGGEKQRVTIAQVICQDTRILLLDEPTSNLDINYQIEVMNVISEIKKKKELTILAVFHDLNLALQYADSVILMKDGEVFKQGTVEEVVKADYIRAIFKTNVIIEENPYTKKMFIMPLNHSRIINEKNMYPRKIHILAGGGTGSYLFHILQSERHTLSTCILSSIDSDSLTAKKMNIPVVETEPFVRMSSVAKQENERLIMQAEVVIMTRVPIGPGNSFILSLLEFAVNNDKQIYVIDGSRFYRRDFTDGSATSFYNKLLDRCPHKIKNIENEEELVLLLRKPPVKNGILLSEESATFSGRR